MSSYRLPHNWFGTEIGSIGPRLHSAGAIVQVDGPVPEHWEAVGEGDHEFAPRRYDIEGGAGLGLLKRAEMSSTRR